MEAALDWPIVHGASDTTAPVSCLPEHSRGFVGRPGIAVHRRDGTGWAPRFEHPIRIDHDTTGLTLRSEDGVSGLALETELRLDPASGVLRVRTTVENTADTPLWVDGLTVSLPLPHHATELLTFSGRWCRELHPQRQPWLPGSHVTENRRGRTSHDHLPLLFAGTPGFGEHHGEVWGLHLAWSGNNTVLAEHLADGRRYVQLGELLHPGEICLEPGERYRTPSVSATWSDAGLTPASRRFHRHLRARGTHPSRPRPVLLNTWEAVYFDHDPATLRALADRAARAGIERFVLDDGWFGGRRNEHAGLGDWRVSPEAHPDGLGPLIDHVRSLGMEFGIWVEPEMVNPDSDLFRAHPDWALVTPGQDPVLSRFQLVVNLAHPDAYAHVLGQLDALLADHDIGYVKWDMNRDHIAGSGTDGRAGSHAQTLALYRLLDDLLRRHPDVEFESCSSGGGRMDHEILERACRVWTSDCNDALERQVIQRHATLFLPPEVLGTHIGPPTSHTTGRRHGLAFRAGTAIFGHLGVEWNLLDLDDHHLDVLAEVIAVHKRLRPLLHGGEVIRLDHPDPAAMVHGVVSADRDEAVIAIVQLVTAPNLVPAPLRLPGSALDPARRYHVEPLVLGTPPHGPARSQPGWLATGITLTGRQLALHGIRPPVMHPETVALFHLTAVGEASG